MPVYAALFRARDTALLDDQEYTFNFHVTTTGSSDDAWELANEAAEAYVGNVAPPNVTVYEVTIRNRDVVNGVQSRPVNLPGTRVTTGDALPGWNTAKIQGRTSVGGRLHTWYPRCGLTEADVNGQFLTLDMQGAVVAFNNALLLINGFCDRLGNEFISMGFTDHVQMRQLGWHRRTRPGFKRGWVPA